LPDGDATPAGAIFLKFLDDALGLFGVPEGDEDLVEDNVVQDLEASGGKLVGETAGLFAVTLDHAGNAIPA